MSADAFGQFCALMAALLWALALVMFRQSGRVVRPIALNLFKNTVAIAFFGATLLLIAALGRESLFDEDVQPLTLDDWLILILSGAVGIAIADTLFLYSLNRLGVGWFVIVDCLYSPSTILFAWLITFEQLEWPHYVGASLIIVSILIATQQKRPEGVTRGQMFAGIVAGAGAAILMGFGIALAEPVIERTSTVLAATIRITAGNLILLVFVLARPNRGEVLAIFKPQHEWRRLIPAAALGTYLTLLFWHTGFKFTGAAINAILNQTTFAFALILAWLLLREPLTARKWASVALAASGVIVVTMAEFIAKRVT